jgi:peptide/nickel transport system substrate-binding protein
VNRFRRTTAGWLSVILLLAGGCAAPTAPASEGRSSQAVPVRVTPKRVTASILSDPPSLYPLLNPSSIRGTEVISELANSGLAVVDNQGSLRAQLAEAVPSVDNGLWRVNPDGSAETTWRLRDGILWHDGTPFTSADLVFTASVLRDREIGVARNQAFDYIAGVEAPDARTVTVKWRQPYNQADQMFTRALAYPFPRHLLEAAYQADKGSFLGLPYWSVEYVGTGPFKLKDFEVGSHMVFAANDAYPHGRPKLDEIQIKFIPDPNTTLANVLGGGVEFTLGKTVSIEQGLEAQRIWQNGRIDSSPGNAVVMRIQHLYTEPPIMRQLPFRRALEHAIDQQQIVDTLLGGLAPPAETSLFSPLEAPELTPAKDQVVRYSYDPRRSIQLIEQLGNARGSDGLFRDASGQTISVGIRTNVEDVNQKATFAVRDYWRQVGVEAAPEIFLQSQATDQEYRAKFPSYELLRGLDLSRLEDFHSAQRKTAENRWRGQNGGYANPEYDTLIERYLVTIPLAERVDLLGKILNHLSDQVVMTPLFWDIEVILLGNRIQNVTARHRQSSHAWNAREWDVK